jgi:hypothetical protein
MQTDPISIMVYIILFIILYFCFAIIFKICYLYLSLPPFAAFKTYTYDWGQPLMFIVLGIWELLYWTPLMIAIAVIFAIIILVIVIIYVIWLILQNIPIIGFVIIATVPPFRQFEEAGIFKLLEDIQNAIVQWLPKNVAKMFGRLFLIIVKFTKDKIIDIAKLIKPDLQLNASEIDVILGKEAFENPTEAVDIHRENTSKAIDMKNEADKYKSLDSITPNMEMQDRMSVIFNNEAKKIQITLNNTPNNMKLQFATLPGSPKSSF